MAKGLGGNRTAGVGLVNTVQDITNTGNNSNPEQTYFILPDGKLLDAKGTHNGTILTTDQYRRLGLTAADKKRVEEAHAKDTASETPFRSAWRKIFSAGAIRVNRFGNQLAVETKTMDQATFRQLKRLFMADKLWVPPNSQLFWSANDTGNMLGCLVWVSSMLRS